MKPTPLQARTLRLLAADRTAEIRVYGRGNVSVERDNHWHPKETEEEHQARREADERFKAAHKAADIKRLRRASVDAMARAGWIEERTDRGWPRYGLATAGLAIVELLGPKDFEDHARVAPPLVPLDLIRRALKERWHYGLGWVWLFEFAILRDGMARGRRLDALAVNCGSERSYERMAFEIKRSRGDFLGELKDPHKRPDGRSIVDRFWYVTPEGLVRPDEVPGDCGLVWVDEDGRAVIKRKAPKLAEAPTDRRLLGEILTYMVDRPEQQEWRKAMKGL